MYIYKKKIVAKAQRSAQVFLFCAYMLYRPIVEKAISVGQPAPYMEAWEHTSVSCLHLVHNGSYDTSVLTSFCARNSEYNPQ